MAKGTLSKRVLDVLNHAAEIKSEIEFCDEGGGLQKEMYHFAEWLGDHLRSELQREAWEEPELGMDEDGVSLHLYSATWELPDEDHVAFSFVFPNLFYDPPCVQLYLPDQEVFGRRNELLDRLRPKLKRSGFTDHYERGDPDPSCPMWKYIRLEEFRSESGFDLDTFVGAIVDAFRQLMEIEPMIEDAFPKTQVPQSPTQSERLLKTIAVLDTEWEGAGTARRMTQLAIINVAYDADADAVIGVLEEYCMNAGETLDETRARGALERADFIVAHNAFSADKPLVDSHLPEAEKLKWLCSFRGIDWKELLGVQSRSLETLMGKTGLRYTQDHNAYADARDLKRLLALKRNGHTYLSRLLASS